MGLLFVKKFIFYFDLCLSVRLILTHIVLKQLYTSSKLFDHPKDEASLAHSVFILIC